MDDEKLCSGSGGPAGSWPVLGQRKSRWGNEAVSDGKPKRWTFNSAWMTPSFAMFWISLQVATEHNQPPHPAKISFVTVFGTGAGQKSYPRHEVV